MINLHTILVGLQLGSAVLLIITILLQQRGGGLTSIMGAGTLEYSTKRGAEKVIFNATIVFAVIFIAVSIVRVILQ